MSRPKKLVHRNQLIQFKVTALEKKIIQKNAEKVNLSISELARNALFNITIYKPLSNEEIEAYRMLIRFKTAFDKTANYFKNSDPRFAGELLSVAREIKTHLQKFKK
jgi:hypothetical protein